MPIPLPTVHQSWSAPTPHRSRQVQGFQLAYDRQGAGPAVIALHGWPSDREDWRATADLLGPDVDFIAVDLRGFGDSDAHSRDPAQAYTPAAQAESVLALIDELELDSVVIAGYDLGSMVAEQVVRMRPEVVGGLVLAPPVPGLARHLSDPQSLRERWYIPFHQTQLADDLLDGNGDAVRSYLTYFWSRWSGPNFQLDHPELDRLVNQYSVPAAFRTSTAVYRSGRPSTDETPITTATTILWPDSDPLFPAAWASSVDHLFPNADVQMLADTGHFAPREAPAPFAAAIHHHTDRIRTAQA